MGILLLQQDWHANPRHCWLYSRACQSYRLQRHVCKGYSTQDCSQGPRTMTMPGCGPAPWWLSVSFLFLTLSLATNRHSFLLYLHMSPCISFQVSLPCLLWTTSESSLPSLSIPLASGLSEDDAAWGTLEKTLGGKQHYKSRRIQEDYGQGMEPVSSDMTSFGCLFFWWYDSFEDFLHVFIHFFFDPFNKDVLSTYYVSGTFTQGISRSQMVPMAISSWEHAFPSEINMYPTARSKENKKWVCLLGFLSLPIQSPDTFYQVRQQLCTQCAQSALLCFIIQGSLISMGHYHPLFIFSTHIPNEELFLISRLVATW